MFLTFPLIITFFTLGRINRFDSSPGVWSAGDWSCEGILTELANCGFSPPIAGKFRAPHTGDHPGPDQQRDGGGLRDRAEVNNLRNLAEGAGAVGEGRNKPGPMPALANREPMGEAAVMRLPREDFVDPDRQTVCGAAAVGPGNLNHAMPKHRPQRRVNQSAAASDSPADFGSAEEQSGWVRATHQVAAYLPDGEPDIVGQLVIVLLGGFHGEFPVVGRVSAFGDDGGIGGGKGGSSQLRFHGG